MLAHRQSWNFRANPAAQMAAGDGVLRDFQYAFSKDGSKTARLTKTSSYSTLITTSHNQNVSDVLYTRQFVPLPRVDEVVRVAVETRRDIAMRTSIRRQLAMRLVVAIGFAALQATLATTSLAKTSVVHHRAAPAASSADSADRGSWRVPPTGYAADPATVLAPRYGYPNPFPGECTEDEGYGRFKRCDSGP
jgi:hypothetical protein